MDWAKAGAPRWVRGHAPPENFEILHSRRRILSHSGIILDINYNIIYLYTVKNT